ncbi:hypothetical protein HYU14_01320 [Candidatus Woesearchaeota archaeon]|nr:hypothetical protein [Candidatus Woesearchaeota archaeon]
MPTAKSIPTGAFIRFNNEIYKVARKEIVAYGTHCHSKTKLFLQGLFTKGEKSFNLSHEEHVEQVDISKKAGQVIAKIPPRIQVMDMVSFETLDADIAPELLAALNESDEVTFITVEGKTTVLDKR